MVSNGYRWRRYDNLIRSKHVTVYAKVQVMQQRYMPGRCHQVPRMLPRETQVDVSKCHACHAKCSYMSPSATPATQKAAATTAAAENRARHQSQPSAIRATPATWNGGCLKVPRLPRKVQLHVAKCHACHAKSRGDHGGRSKPSAPPEPAQCDTCHACHVKRRWMSQSATPATQSAATCRQVPRLPRKKPRRPRRPLRTERATRASPVPYVPRLPRETVDVSKCHACHAKCSYMSPSATPATRRPLRTERATRASPVPYVPRLPREKKVDVLYVSKLYVSKLCVSKLCVSKLCVSTLCVSKLCVSKLCVSKLCVSKLCVSKLCVSKLYVSKLCVSKLCVSTLCVSKLCVSKLCVSKLCVCKLCVSTRRWEADGGGRDAESKTRTPHKDVGKYLQCLQYSTLTQEILSKTAQISMHHAWHNSAFGCCKLCINGTVISRKLLVTLWLQLISTKEFPVARAGPKSGQGVGAASPYK